MLQMEGLMRTLSFDHIFPISMMTHCFDDKVRLLHGPMTRAER
jgi:hypothetical protein